MMAAGVPRLLAFDGVAIRDRVLVDARQRVVLGQDADHGLAAACRRDECRRNSGDAGFHLEARAGQFLLQQLGTLHLLVADFRPFPHRAGELGIAGLALGKKLAEAIP